MMTRQFEGKVAPVTGARQGIGADMARLFAQAGATVVLASRSEELAHNVDAIKANGGEAIAVVHALNSVKLAQGKSIRAMAAFFQEPSGPPPLKN